MCRCARVVTRLLQSSPGKLEKIHKNVPIDHNDPLISFWKNTLRYVLMKERKSWQIILKSKRLSLEQGKMKRQESLLSFFSHVQFHWSLIRFSGGPLVLTVCWVFFAISFSSDFTVSGIASASFFVWSTCHQKQIVLQRTWKGQISVEVNNISNSDFHYVEKG